MDTIYTRADGEDFFIRIGQYEDVDRFVVDEVPQDYLWNRLGDIRTALDVGAHIGVWTRYLKKLYPSAQVICAEPHPDNYRLLNRNVYGLSTVLTVNAAVQYAAPFYRLHKHQVNSGGHTTEPLTSDEQGNGEAETLESLIDRWGWPDCDLLKLDCEGAEVEILNHADLTRFHRIVGEYHAGVNAFEADCLPALDAAGFTTEIHPHASWPLNGIFYCRRLP